MCQLLVLNLESTHHLDKKRNVLITRPRPFLALFDACLLSQLLLRNGLPLHRNLWQVNRHRVVHLVMFQVILDQECHNFCLWVLVNFTGNRVCPLESSGLFSVLVSVVLDGLEYLCAKLGSERCQGAFLFEVLNYNVL